MISLVSLLRHLGKGAVYNLYNNMIKETKYCSVGMEKHFNKELVLTREDNEENFTNTLQILKNLLNVGSVTKIVLIVMF